MNKFIHLGIHMFKSYRYRIYPTEVQKQKIEQTIGVCRLVYNLALQVKTEAYKINGTKLRAFDLCYQLSDMKKEYKWMQEVDSQALQGAVKKLEGTFEKFFNGGGYPKYKSKKGRQSFKCPNGIRRIDFDKGLLTIPKIKKIPIRVSRTFTGKIKTVSIIRVSSGKYFASILVDNNKYFPILKPLKKVIGIDLGIKDFATLSDGTKIKNPKYYRENLQRLKCLHRRVSKKKKDSNNHKKAILKLSIHHEHIANLRADFLQKLSSAITKQYDTICVEDLNVSGMVKNRKLSQAISDVGWGYFISMLAYKSKWNGNNFIKIGRFEPSSKMCYKCGVVNELLLLKDREWTCANCETIHDRDTSAAINIKQMGLKQYYLNNSPEGIRGGLVELLPKGGARKQEIFT